MSDTIGFSQADLIKKGQETGLDARKIVQWITGIILVSLIGWYVFPFITTIIWNTVHLAEACGALFLVIVAFKWIKKWAGTINKMIAKYTLGLMCEWDEFVLQEQQIDQAEEDVDKMGAEREKIEGEYIKNAQEVAHQQDEFKENMKTAEVAKRNNDADAAEDAMLAAARNQTYIETIQPICEDMKFIIDFSADLQKVLKRKIKNAKADLQTNKSVFYAAQRGAKMLKSAEKAMIGDPTLNSNAEFAKQKVKEKIALSIGQMRSSMSILSEVSKEENYRNKAKMELAKERLKAINASTGSDAVALPQAAPSLTFQGIQQPIKTSNLL